MQSKNSQDVTIGNPQERLHFYIGYLIGIIDGEGAYQLSPDKKYFSPMITINNTDEEIIRLTCEALTQLGLDHHVWYPKQYGKEYRQATRVYIRGIEHVKKATDLILKYPSGKDERAKLLNEFCTYRLKKQTPYSDIEIQFKEKLRQMNAKYKGAKSSETIRLTVNN